ncbi:uncharacterized protein BXZ73DRAFT_23422, partial [Epithele typhae]|uniref:uncharacterized protein n=1 Tax=Epithele typhae TaxID=378194 RepID=UPI0020075950
PMSAPTAPIAPAPVLCLGLSVDDNAKIGLYMSRPIAGGGGARSLVVIAKEKNEGKLFSELTREQKQEVVDWQISEYKWLNDQRRQRVYSTACMGALVISSKSPTPARLSCGECLAILKLDSFRRAISRPVPEPHNFKYVNFIYRDEALGKLYARITGLQDLLNPKSKTSTSPFVRYALGAIRGKFKNGQELLGGILEGFMTIEDKERRGVGKQGFKWSEKWARICHVIAIDSPKAYRSLAQYLPVPGLRGLQIKAATQPMIPFEISPRCLDMTVDVLKGYDYPGLVSLCVDDTKLLAAVRLHYDPSTKTSFLIGGVDGPIAVADPDNMQTALELAKSLAAPKMRLWCVQVPMPSIMPHIVAAVPIANKLKAPDLNKMSEAVLQGLLERDVPVVSYVHDGTSVERKDQLMSYNHADSYCDFYVPAPTGKGSEYSLKIKVACFGKHLVTFPQDHGHGRKTARNNLFSGAKIIALGNFTALYRRIHQVAFEPDSPLYHRDVEKLDRQDDNAAARLFSASTLKYIITHHPEYLGEIIYLFIFGELIDAWQNRKMTHTERVVPILRAWYFMNMWHVFLERAGYARGLYSLSHEAWDIFRILIESYLALLFIHRHYSASRGFPFPFCPWLHSTEACEHSFGLARQNVKDFTAMDFYYMIKHIQIKQAEAFRLGQTTDPHARASGYNHTYVDSRDVDLCALATYPDDDAIQKAADEAFAEAESLVVLLGIAPSEAHFPRPSTSTRTSGPVPNSLSDLLNVPPSGHHVSSEENVVDSTEELATADSEESVDSANELQAALDREESAGTNMKRSSQEEDGVENVMLAAVSVAVDDMCKVYVFPPGMGIAATAPLPKYVPLVTSSSQSNLPPPAPLPSRFLRVLKPQQLELKHLVELRVRHQTRQEADGVRIRSSKADSVQIDSDTDNGGGSISPKSIRSQILAKYYQVSREQRMERGAGTGVERQVRWKGDIASGLTGNSANAAASAIARA